MKAIQFSSKPFNKFWIKWTVGYVGLALSTTVLATSCPSGGVDTGDDTVTAIFALPNDGEGNISCDSTQVGGVFVTTDQQINTNSSVMIALPDTEPSGASNPVRTYMFLPTGSTPIPHSITCAEATVTSSSNVNSIVLEDNESCSLTMKGNSGTDGGEVIYTGNLSRTGEIYSLSDGEVCGAPYQTCSTTTSALATSCPNGGVDTGDDTVTAIFALPNDGEGNISCDSTQVGGVFVTTDQQINTNSSVMIALPDTEPSGASNPVRTYMFLPTGSTPIPHSITCAEATVTSSSNVNSIVLEDNESCSLTMKGNSGTDGGEVIYTGNLSRTGEIYSLSDGEVCGAPYQACSTTTSALATSCPSGGVDTGDDTVTAIFALPNDGEGNISCDSTQVGGVFVTTDQQINTNSSVMIALPDTEPSGASNPVRTYMFLPTGSTPIPHSITCAEATVTSSSNVNSIVLEDNESCSLTMKGNSGTDGGEVIYTGNLSRTGEIYSLSDGEVCGAPYQACSTTTSTLATSCPSGGVDTGDDTVTAIFALPNDGEGNISCDSTQVGGVFVTTDQQINTNSSVMIALPDTEPSGASNPVRTYMFLPTGSTPIPHSITCAEATVTSSSNVNSIVLEDNESCSLTMKGNSGTDGGEVIYTGNLSRTGEIYSLSDGEVCGAPYQACSTTTSATKTFEEGRQTCIDNPSDCNLFSQADIEAAINACVVNPTSCGIQTDTELPYYDIDTFSLHIPALLFSGEVYQATLQLNTSSTGDESFDLLSLSKDGQAIITHSSLQD